MTSLMHVSPLPPRRATWIQVLPAWHAVVLRRAEYAVGQGRGRINFVGRERSNRTYPAIGINEAHHSLSHHQNDAEKLAKLTKINAYHIAKASGFLEKLRATPDGDGSLLDHLTLVYGSGLSDGNRHDHSPLPTLVIGGGAGRLRGGAHLSCPKDTPMTNLLLTVLGSAGVREERLGDSTGALDLSPLA